jgi:queuine tRNA-ribosyltransferase
MVNEQGELDEEMSKYIAELIPDEFPKFALGVGKPWDIARCYEFGWDIFDCVLPTRDGRHKRLYNFKANSTNLKSPDSYEFTYISRGKFSGDIHPIGLDCYCFTCQNYSRGYLHHLFKIKDMLAYRLAVIHNLRVYNRVVENLGRNLTEGIN